MPSGVSPGWMMRAVMPSAQAEAETRNASDLASWSREIALAELVLDQAVGGGGIRHAQQRLGQHHQGQAFLGGERIFPQQFLDAAEPAALGADRLDQARGVRVDARLAAPARAGAGRAGRAAMALSSSA